MLVIAFDSSKRDMEDIIHWLGHKLGDAPDYYDRCIDGNIYAIYTKMPFRFPDDGWEDVWTAPWPPRMVELCI